MDMEVKIKEEAICFEEASNTSFDSYKILSEEMHLKEELKSELAEPRETQPSTNIKDEICVDERTVSQLVACFKEEDKFGNIELLTGDPEDSCNSSCNILKKGNEVICILPTHNECNLKEFSDSEENHIHSIRQWEFYCNECGSKFSRKSHLRQHIITHTGVRPHSCHQCDKKFSRKGSLRDHLLTHSGERLLFCDQCGKKYSRKSTLRDHLITHSGERPYICDQCGCNFSHRSSLRQHLVTHTGEHPHFCKQCGKEFSSVSYLKEHQVTHRDQRPYSCHECGRKFSQKWYLRKHLITHTGVRPFSCALCANTFTRKCDLRRHDLIHTGVRPHSCNQCGNKFSQKSHLRQHVLTHTHKLSTTFGKQRGKKLSYKTDHQRHLFTQGGDCQNSCDD